LVPEEEKPACLAQLVKAVHRAQDHIDCGILGAKALFHVLSDHGHHDLAYTIATQPDFPGYGDWIAQGATTLWEDWPDKEGSLNHIMFGDIVTWFFRSLAGIQVDPQEPGFRHVIFRPRPVADLSFARAQTQSPFGKIKAHWHRQGDQFSYTVLVPPNTRATVHMPDGSTHRVFSGEHHFVSAVNQWQHLGTLRTHRPACGAEPLGPSQVSSMWPLALGGQDGDLVVESSCVHQR